MGEIFQDHRVGYEGSDSSIALRLEVDEILEGLPPVENTAMVPAVDIADDELKWSLENPHRYLKPKSEWPKRSRPGRIMATKETWQRLAQILVDRGIIVPVDEDLIPRTESGDLILGGCFAVRKKGSVPKHLVQICRLIFNLKNNNAIQNMITSDLFELPVHLSWEHVSMTESEALLLSGEDIKDAFCIFKIPREWSRLLAVNGKTWVTCQDGKVRHTYLGCALICMGWRSVVGLCQRWHRRVIRGLVDHLINSAEGRGLPARHEIKRSGSFPLHYGWLP